MFEMDGWRRAYRSWCSAGYLLSVVLDHSATPISTPISTPIFTPISVRSTLSWEGKAMIETLLNVGVCLLGMYCKMLCNSRLHTQPLTFVSGRPLINGEGAFASLAIAFPSTAVHWMHKCRYGYCVYASEHPPYRNPEPKSCMHLALHPSVACAAGGLSQRTRALRHPNQAECRVEHIRYQGGSFCSFQGQDTEVDVMGGG